MLKPEEYLVQSLAMLWKWKVFDRNARAFQEKLQT